MKKEKWAGYTPDDDNDIRVIEDLSSLRGDDADGGLWSEMRSLLRDIVFAGLIAVLIVVFVVQPVRVEGQSMMPKLHDQDQVHQHQRHAEFERVRHRCRHFDPCDDEHGADNEERKRMAEAPTRAEQRRLHAAPFLAHQG